MTAVARRAAPAGAAALCVALAGVLSAAPLGCSKSRATEQRDAGRAGAAAPPRPPGIALTLALAADERSLDVEVRITGPEATGVRALRATRGWADTRPMLALQQLVVEDARGMIHVAAQKDEPLFHVLPFERAPVGDLVVRYKAYAGADPSRFSLHRGEGGVSAIGHGFLLRPALDVELPLSVRFQPLKSGTELATSLDGRQRGTVEDLAAAVYVAGSVSTFVSDAGDRSTVAFAPLLGARRALEVAAKARAFAGRAFGPAASGPAAPLSLFLIGGRGLGKGHDGAAPGEAIAVWLDAGRALDEAVMIVVAHEALHAVFGGTIRVDAGGRDAAWFAEGFATHYARRALFDEGLIDAEAFLADVVRLEEGRAKSADPGDAHAIGYALGARYAALLDAAVRARSKGGRSLDDVVRRLGEEALAAKGEALATSVFRAVVAAEIGEADERKLWLGLVAGALPDLPDGAFGPCFGRDRKGVFQPRPCKRR